MAFIAVLRWVLQFRHRIRSVCPLKRLDATGNLSRHWRTILLKDGSGSGEEASGFFVGFMSLQEPPYAGKQRQLPGLTGHSHETPRNHYPTDAAANYQGGYHLDLRD
jgi:hypothetical protein